MALPPGRFFEPPNRRSPRFQYGVVLFIQPGDHTQRVEIERAPDSGGSPGSYTAVATAGPFPRGGGYYIDERPNSTATWWYRGRHEAGSQYGSAGAYKTLAVAVSPRLITSEDRDRLGNDSYPAPQATVSVNTNGTADLSVDGDAWVQSYRYLSSKSAFPTDASTVATGTINSNRQFTRSAIETLHPGQTCFVTVVPYSGTGATGTQGESIHVRAAFNPTDMPQGTIAIDEDGNVEVTVDGPQWCASYMFKGDTSAFPSEATVRASGTTQDGRQISISSASFATLGIGDTIFVTLLPYSATAAGGTEGPSIKLRATRHDFSATKTAYYTASGFRLEKNGGSGSLIDTNADVRPSGFAFLDVPYAIGFPVIPNGVTITEVGFHVYDNDGGAGNRLECILARLDDSASWGYVSITGTDSSAGAGQEIITSSVSESTTGNRYKALVSFIINDAANQGNLRFNAVSITYTMPTSDKAL